MLKQLNALEKENARLQPVDNLLNRNIHKPWYRNLRQVRGTFTLRYRLGDNVHSLALCIATFSR